MIAMEDSFLKTGDVAKFFGVTLRTIKNWRQLGKLVPVKINEHGHYLYSSSQVEVYKKILIAQNSNKAKDKFSTTSAQKPQKNLTKIEPKKAVAKTSATKTDQQKNKSYGNLLQGKPTNALATSSGKKLKPNLADNVTVLNDNVQIVIEQFSNVKLNVPTLKVLDACILKLTQHFPHGTDVSDETLVKYKNVKVTADEYMEMTGIKDRKQAYEQLKAAMNTLYRISFEWDDKAYVKGKKKDVHYKMRLAESLEETTETENCPIPHGKSKEFDGYIVLSFSMKMARYFATAYIMPYPYKLLTINSHNNPHSYFIGRKLALHYNMNIGKANSNRISVKSLIATIPDLPKYQDFQKGKEHITQQIIQPFERDLIALQDKYGILKSWRYCNSGGEPITDAQVEKYNYDTWIEWLVEFELDDYPDQSERIIERKLALLSSSKSK